MNSDATPFPQTLCGDFYCDCPFCESYGVPSRRVKNFAACEELRSDIASLQELADAEIVSLGGDFTTVQGEIDWLRLEYGILRNAVRDDGRDEFGNDVDRAAADRIAVERRDRDMGWLPLEECGGHYFEGEMGA